MTTRQVPARSSHLLLAFLSCAAVGCTSRVDETADTTSDSLVNGSEDNGGRYRFVGRIHRPDGSFLCSGSLVGARTVLTAGHCVDFAGDYTYPAETRPYFYLDNAELRVTRSLVHPNHFGDPQRYTVMSDLAFLFLEGAELDLRPVEISGEPVHGAQVTIVGYGRTSDGVPSDQKRRYGTNYVISPSRILETTNENGAHLCAGDSGGPILLQTDPPQLVGVSATSSDPCGKKSKAAPITPNWDWIQRGIFLNRDSLAYMHQPTELPAAPNQGLYRGDTLTSQNRYLQLAMEYSGSLVLYRAGRRVWSTDGGPFAVSANMQRDGNFVIYDALGVARWATHTSAPDQTASLRLQNDGNLVLYRGSQPLWETNTVWPGPSTCRVLAAGQALHRGNKARSCNGFVSLEMQPDGNLVTYLDNRVPIFASETFGSSGYTALMQPDGNFVLYDLHEAPIWHTGTFGNPGAYLAQQNDGNLVVYTATHRPIWSSHKFLPRPRICGLISARQALFSGSELESCDRRFRLKLEGDGNLVLRTGWDTVLWTSGTAGRDVYIAIMQPDGNLVLYDRQDRAKWNTGTWNNPGAHLVLQDDGNLVLYTADYRPIWATNTNVPPPSDPPPCFPGQRICP